jgi:hypothetical protein
MNTLTRKLIAVILVVGAVSSVTNCRQQTYVKPVSVAQEKKEIATGTKHEKEVNDAKVKLAQLQDRQNVGDSVTNKQIEDAQINLNTKTEAAVNYLEKLNPANWSTTAQLVAAAIAGAIALGAADYGFNALMNDRETYMSRAYGVTKAAVSPYVSGAYESAKSGLSSAYQGTKSGLSSAYQGTKNRTNAFLNRIGLRKDNSAEIASWEQAAETYPALPIEE